MIRAILSFLGQYYEKGNMVKEKWDELANADNFDAYRTSTVFQNLNFDKKAEPTKTNSSSSSSTTNTKSDRTPADEFKRGIRRDGNAFSVLKDVKHFDEWNRSTIAQARSQGLGDVLNSEFQPEENDTDALDLFQEKQAFMYSVFNKILLTDTGRELVRQHDKKFDAQKIYASLVEKTLHSTKASLDSSHILSYVTTVKLGDGSWRGTTHSFILHWKEQVRLYDSQQDSAIDKFSMAQKKAMLENTVHGIEALRMIKIQADQYKVLTGEMMNYEHYLELLESAAESYDSQFNVRNMNRGFQRPEKRAVYNHFLDGYDDSVDDYDHDINTSIYEILANAHSRVPGSTMSKE